MSLHNISAYDRSTKMARGQHPAPSRSSTRGAAAEAKKKIAAIQAPHRGRRPNALPQGPTQPPAQLPLPPVPPQTQPQAPTPVPVQPPAHPTGPVVNQPPQGLLPQQPAQPTQPPALTPAQWLAAQTPINPGIQPNLRGILSEPAICSPIGVAFFSNFHRDDWRMLRELSISLGHRTWPEWNAARDPLDKVSRNHWPVRYLQVQCGNVPWLRENLVRTPHHLQDPPRSMEFEWERDVNQIHTAVQCPHNQFDSQYPGQMEFTKCEHPLHNYVDPEEANFCDGPWICAPCARRNAEEIRKSLLRCWRYRVLPECRPCSQRTWNRLTDGDFAPTADEHPTQPLVGQALADWERDLRQRKRDELHSNHPEAHRYYARFRCQCDLRPFEGSGAFCADCANRTAGDFAREMLHTMLRCSLQPTQIPLSFAQRAEVASYIR